MVLERASKKLLTKFNERDNKPIDESNEINRFSDTSYATQTDKWKFKQI